MTNVESVGRSHFSIAAEAKLTVDESMRESVRETIAWKVVDRNGFAASTSDGRFGIGFDCIDGAQEEMIADGVERLLSAFEATDHGFQLLRCFLVGPPGIDSTDDFGKVDITEIAAGVAREIQELQNASAEMFL